MLHTISFNIRLNKYETDTIINKFNIINDCYQDLSDFINYDGITLAYIREKEMFPKIIGVLIVASGADNIVTRSNLQNATLSLLDIELNQIEILTRK